MSDSDDPFGRRDRTIIRPNPGGRRPEPPAAAPPPAGGPPPPPAPMPYPPAGGGYQAPPPSYPPQQPYQAPTPYPPPQPAYPSYPQAPAGTGQPDWGTDNWIRGSTPAGAQNPYQQQAQPLMPAPQSAHVAVDISGVQSNPLLKSSASLLLLLGRLRAALSRATYAQLMDQVAQSIERFEIDARAAGAPTEQVMAAKYALAATADDIVQNLPSDDRHLWTKYSMLARFFGERTGGVRFFSELDRAKANPAVNADLLELMHACLSLGFEGIHRTSGGGAGALQMIRRDVYETIRRVRSKTIEELSPHWRGQPVSLQQSRFPLPVWVVAAV
jgi:type VI secretion system protein ImpK